MTNALTRFARQACSWVRDSWSPPSVRRALVVGGGLALAAELLQPAPPPRTIEGLAQILGAAAAVRVAPNEIVWEPSPGLMTELFWGRWLLFLGRSPDTGGLRDVFRARVRLTIEGRPILVSDWRNLTSTTFGDEQQLVMRDRRAAFATAAYGHVQSISLLELGASSNSAGTEADPRGAFEQFASAITHLQETGDAAGLRRTDVQLDAPTRAVSLQFEGDHLVVARADDAPFAIGRGGEIEGDAAAAVGARVEAPPALHKRAILWAVDTVRAEVGPEPVAALEGAVFHARDLFRRAVYGVFGQSAGSGRGQEIADTAGSVLPGASASPLAATPSLASPDLADPSPGVWPPPTIAPTWSDPQLGEGTWSAVDYPWLKRLPAPPGQQSGGAPAYFYRTTVRPDPERPYAKVLIVAMDMRQLELDMEGGVEDPKPLTGAHGTGKIPRDPKVISRVVGAFNGAFKTTHGEYGMMVHKRVLLPPKANAATVVVTRDRRVGLGTWGTSTTIPDDLISFRQNLEPLVEDGRFSPSGRKQWGWQLDGTSMMTERSGVCVTAHGQLLYLWGDEVSAMTLGKAMLLASCSYGMHLDMNPHHTGFVFANVRSLARRDYEAKLLTQEMEILPERYLEYSPKDFFYLMLRDATPAGDVGWTEDVGAQPNPTWSTAVWHALVQTAKASDAARAVQVELWAFDQSRVSFRLLKAHKEPERREYAGVAIPPQDARRVLAALGLGNPRDARESNVAKAAFAKLPMAAFRVGGGPGPSSLELATLAEDAAPSDPDALSLPLVLDDAAVNAAAMERRSMRRRAALCVSSSGHLVVATATTDSDEVTASALVRAGCTRAVSLDLGAHRPTFLHRAGSGTAPLARYDETALYILGEPMAPRAFRWAAP
jgi:hypothetical protein